MTATVDPPHWADAIDSPPQALADVQRALPVRLIATPREVLETCRRDESLASVVARNTERYDHFPVLDEADRIVGIIDLVPYHKGKPAPGVVADRMAPLSEDQLIGSDASILDFVSTADKRPCRLVVAGLQIVGFVTLSDLQRLPVRAALFALITHAEITMANAIKTEAPDMATWLPRLSDRRQVEVKRKVQRARGSNSLVEEILETQFGDKVDIIAKSPAFDGPADRFRADMGLVRKLRNGLAHANGYAATRPAAMRLCETLRALDDWISILTNWPLGK